jgi:beta-N-acetylhexosaminidase
MKKCLCAFLALSALFFLSCTTTTAPRAEKPSPAPGASSVKQAPDGPVISSLPQGRPRLRRSPSLRLELPAVPQEAVTRYLGRMSTAQKVGQRFLIWVPGTVVSPKIRDIITAGYPGGVILTAQNVSSPLQVRELTTGLQKLAREARPAVSLFIAAEQEGGRVSAFRFPQLTAFPPPFTWGEREDPVIAESVGYITARELVSLGCNMNLAPVLDLSGRGDDSFIGNRSLGWKPEVVGALGSAYARGSTRGGVVAVPKHFPGHGIVAQDSHARLPVVDIQEDYLWQRHLKPFRIAAKGGAEAFLAAHVIYRNVDPENPASLSTRLIQGVLRNELGFDGLVVSDAINVPAIARTYSLPQVLSHAINAGVDLIQVSDVYSILDLEREVYQLLASREITREDIDRGVARILTVKARYGLIL